MFVSEDWEHGLTGFKNRPTLLSMGFFYLTHGCTSILYTVQCPLTEILYALKQNKYVFLRELLKQCFVNSEIIQYKDSRNVEGT